MTLRRDEIANHVHDIFEQRLSIRLPADDVDLIDSGLIDSLTLVELLSNIEEMFGLDLSEADLDVDDFRTAGRIVHLVEARTLSTEADGA